MRTMVRAGPTVKGLGKPKGPGCSCENAPTCILQIAAHSPFVLENGMVFHMQNGDIYLVQAAHGRPLPCGL